MSVLWLQARDQPATLFHRVSGAVLMTTEKCRCLPSVWVEGLQPDQVSKLSYGGLRLQQLTLKHASCFAPVAVFVSGFSPGPAYAIDPTVTHKGKDGTPRYSISGRHKDLGESACNHKQDYKTLYTVFLCFPPCPNRGL